MQRKDESDGGSLHESVGIFSFYTYKGTIYITSMSFLTQDSISSGLIGEDNLFRGSGLKLPQPSDQSQGVIVSFILKKTEPLPSDFDQRWEQLYNKGQAILEKKVDH